MVLAKQWSEIIKIDVNNIIFYTIIQANDFKRDSKLMLAKNEKKKKQLHKLQQKNRQFIEQCRVAEHMKTEKKCKN